MVMHLKSCCCGCSLKTGAVFIGVLSGIGSLIELIVYIMMSSVMTGQAQKEIGISTNFKDSGITLNEDAEQQIETGSTAMSVIFIIMAIVSGIQLIISIILVFGASSDRAPLVKPWIIYAVISVVTHGLLNVVQIIMMLVAGLVMQGMLTLVLVGVSITIGVYFILVVNSFHTELLSNTFPNKV